jgi:hypothetical protein
MIVTLFTNQKLHRTIAWYVLSVLLKGQSHLNSYLFFHRCDIEEKTQPMDAQTMHTRISKQIKSIVQGKNSYILPFATASRHFLKTDKYVT